MNTVPVSVALPAYRSGPELRRTLERICACDPLPQEVLVHCDGGWLPEPGLADGLAVPVRLLSSAQRIGPGGGRHRLFQEAACEVVASFDDDSWPLDRDYFARALAVMHAFPDVVVMSPAIYLKEKPVLSAMSEASLVRSFSGSASVTRRSLYQKLPGYVPVAEAYGVEETDLSLQAHAAGYQILACPWLRAWHDRPQNDNKHAVLPWIRNEVLLAYLRFPLLMQPWGWGRSLRHLWRHGHETGWLPALRALFSALPVLVEFRAYRQRYTSAQVWQHHRHVEQRFLLEPSARDHPSSGGLLGVQPTLAAQARRILYLQYTNPGAYPPLEHSSRMLARAGWQVELMGIRSGGAVTLEFAPHPRVRVRRMWFQRPGWLQKLHFLLFTAWCLARVWRWHPHWVYASDILSTPAAELIRRLFPRCRLIYHEHDSPIPGTVMDSGVAKKVWQARAALGRRADIVVLPNQRRLEAFQAEMKPHGRCFCVWNCPSLDEVSDQILPRRQEGPLRLLYHGTIVPERIGIYVLEAAARCAREVSIRLMGYQTLGAPRYAETLKEAADHLGLGNRFEYLGAIPQRAELMHLGAECHVGLCLLRLDDADINMQHMAGASNKAFDYLSQGLAIIVPDDPEWRALYVDSGCALPCRPHDPEALAKVFRWMADHHAEVVEMGRRGHQLIRQRWHYEAQFAPVLEEMCL